MSKLSIAESIRQDYEEKIERLKEEKESWKRVATKNFNEAEDYKSIIKEVREYIKQTGQYLEDIKRFKVDVLEPNYLDILEILDKGKE